MRSARRTGITKVIVAFRKSANAPKRSPKSFIKFRFIWLDDLKPVTRTITNCSFKLFTLQPLRLPPAVAAPLPKSYAICLILKIQHRTAQKGELLAHVQESI